MKVALIQPPIQDFYHTSVRLVPLGLAYLKAALKKADPECNVVLKDYHSGYGRQTIALPPALRDLRSYYAHHDEGPFSSFYQYYHFGASFDLIGEEMAQWQPDIVGINASFTAYVQESWRVAEAIKARWPHCLVVLGGHHASVAPEHLLQASRAVDAVVIGPGERVLVELVAAWQDAHSLAGVPNLVYRAGGELITTARAPNWPLATLPQPDFSDLDPDRYLYEGRRMSFLMSSRSCPNRCSFCSIHLTHGYQFERRSVDSILREMETLYSQRGVRVFDFEDDNLTYDRSWFLELCAAITNHFRAGDHQLLAMNGVSYHTLDEEMLIQARAAGFKSLNFSLVSRNLSTLAGVNRPAQLAHFERVVWQAQTQGLQVVGYLILGLPGERIEALIESLVHLAQLPVLIGGSPFYLLPGLALVRDFPTFELSRDFQRCRLSALAWTTTISRDQLYTIFIIIRIINFIKGEQIQTAGQLVLQQLLSERQLRFYQRNKSWSDMHENCHFQVDLFEQIWRRLKNITTQRGEVVEL